MGVRVRCKYCDKVMRQCRCRQQHEVQYEVCSDCEGKDHSELNCQDDKLTPIQLLATELHDKQCGLNHVDACGWQYESWDDYATKHPHGAKLRYVKLAEELVGKVKELGL